MTYLIFAIMFPVSRRLFGFYSKGLREIAADQDDRIIVGGEKRETPSGAERDIIL